jgi:hypothetical protein
MLTPFYQTGNYAGKAAGYYDFTEDNNTPNPISTTSESTPPTIKKYLDGAININTIKC